MATFDLISSARARDSISKIDAGEERRGVRRARVANVQSPFSKIPKSTSDCSPRDALMHWMGMATTATRMARAISQRPIDRFERPASAASLEFPSTRFVWRRHCADPCVQCPCNSLHILHSSCSTAAELTLLRKSHGRVFQFFRSHIDGYIILVAGT